MTHDPLCEANDHLMRVDEAGNRCRQCDLIGRVRADQNSKWVDIVLGRKSDLTACSKSDRCRDKAEGVQLVLDDAIGDLGLVL